jgi:hypothetical protein
MISISRPFTTEEDARKWMTSYLSQYHPAGYGTTLSVKFDGSLWIVSGSRFSSCD